MEIMELGWLVLVFVVCFCLLQVLKMQKQLDALTKRLAFVENTKAIPYEALSEEAS
jgi:hypothetical protein